MLCGSTSDRLLVVVIVGWTIVFAACGPGIPLHNGYKSVKATPWRNPKVIKLDDNREGKADGELDYPSQRRAKWYAVDLPTSGDLQVSVEANPSNDGPDFDLGLDIVGVGNRVLAKADVEDEDARELTRTRSAAGLPAGRYLIHVFLQGRLDNSDFEIKVKFAPRFADVETNFPALVPFLPSLALVPVIDDSPESSGSRGRIVVRGQPRGPRKPPPPPPVVEEPTTKVTATVLRATMNDKSTILILSAGSDAGVQDGWKGVVAGVKGVSFRVSSVTQRTCKAVIEGITAEQVAGRKVTLAP